MRHTGTRIVLVGGQSGSGKTTAMAALEDAGFYCVDNLPVQLVDQFLYLCAQSTPPIAKIALAIDAREASFLREVPGVIADLRAAGAEVDIVFLECANDELVQRYRETRRVHPLAPSGKVQDGIEAERQLLDDVLAIADHRIDTSALNVHQLKAAVVGYVSGASRPTVVNLVSFGFRFGPPLSADLLFDVRFLANPYFEPHLSGRTGRDPEVARYVLEEARGVALFERLRDFCDFLLPFYDGEGKAYVTIGIGCTGGRHRSVAVVEALAGSIRGKGREVNVEHRDAERST